jgi:hypothetical protein
MASAAQKVTCWKQVGDLALSLGYFDHAEKCFLEARDLPSLFLLYTATGNRPGLERLQGQAAQTGEANLSFMSSFLLVRLAPQDLERQGWVRQVPHRRWQGARSRLLQPRLLPLQAASSDRGLEQTPRRHRQKPISQYIYWRIEM